jgi:hypothetical protein
MTKRMAMRATATWAGLLAAAVAALILLAGTAAAQTGTNPTLLPWQSTTSLPEGRSRNGAVFYNGYVYLVGGVNNDGTIGSVLYAPVNTNGTVGTWNETTALPGARRTVRPAVWNGYLYLIGGNDGATFQPTSYYAQINANGTLGAWNTTTPLPGGQTSHSTIANNGYLYVVGGNTGDTCITTVRYAQINANGTLGAWNTTSALPMPRCGNVESVTITNGFMYAAGGYDNNNVTMGVYYAAVNANGTLGAWQINANSLAIPREYNGLETLNGYIYAIGGQANVSGGSGASESVEVATLNANGTVGPFSPTTALPGPRGELATERINGRLYVLGGGTMGSGGNPQASVYFTSQAAVDSVPPTVSVTAPTNGATVSGAVTVNANANDNIGVVGVQFLLDGQPLGAEDTTSPYSVSWSTLASTNGTHTLAARARDGGGNQTTSSSVTVTVSNTGQSGLVAAYGMEAGAGTTLLDSSPSNNTANLTDGAWTTAGRYDNAVTFNGTTSRARSTSNVTTTTTWTMEAWVNNPGNQAYETVLTAGTSRDLYLSNGVLSFYSDVISTSFGTVPTGSWQHVALTYDGTALRAYLNGTQLGATQNATIPSVTVPLQAGAWIFGSTNADFFSGTLDEVRFYNRALSAAEIAADMASPVVPPVIDTTPPILSNGLPTGTLPGGTTQTNLQVTTNEAATCRYSTTAGTAYSAMTNTFATTGATGHSTTVTGLANGGSYAFYVRCQDTSSNPTTSDFGITFSVAAPDTTNPTVSITAPATGATVSGTVNVTANAADNIGVVGVQFLLDGVNLGAEDTTSPYSVSWNTAASTNGAHNVTARARDAAGNTTTTPATTVTVSNAAGAGPVAAYGFEETSGSSTNDQTSNNNDGTLSGPTRTAGRYGNGLQFDGNNDLVAVNDSNSLDLTNGMTLEAWVRPSNAPSGFRTIINKRRGSSSYAYQLTAASTTSNRPGTRIYVNNGSRDLTGGTQLTANTWVHLAATYDGATQRLFVNGVEVANRAQTGSITTTTDSLRIGTNNASSEFFAGTIDEVRIYNRALSAAEIQADLNTPVVPPVADTTPPILSNGLPTGTLAAGTTQTNLQVTTNEAATCRYSTTAGTAYSAMTNTFTTTGATGHSTTVVGLANGGSYAFYVRCQDTSANPNTTDFGITFAVGVPDTTNPTVSITAPAGGATVSGTVNVTANAADNIGVVGVQFLLDGVNLGSEDTSSPYSVSWNTTTTNNGTHTISARARDAAGNTTTTPVTTVTVSNAGPSGLVVAYGLNEGSGSTVNSTPAGQQATVTGSTWGTGRFGNAVVFDGGTTRVRTNANITLGTAFTMEAWINNPAAADYETIMTVGENRDLYLFNGQLRFDTGATFVSFGTTLPTDTWTHVAVTYDGTTMRAYVNGAAYGTAQTISLTSVSAPLQVGAWIFGANNYDYFSGTIDNIRIYSRALTQTEISVNQNTPI